MTTDTPAATPPPYEKPTDELRQVMRPSSDMFEAIAGKTVVIRIQRKWLIYEGGDYLQVWSQKSTQTCRVEWRDIPCVDEQGKTLGYQEKEEAR